MASILSESGGMHAWAMATAAVVSAGAALVGTLLVVRRMSLLGDAISHAVLPGIVLAVLAGGRPGGPLALAGAVVAALFLRRFVPKAVPWAHLDLYAWNDANRPGRPEGGEATGLRALQSGLAIYRDSIR